MSDLACTDACVICDPCDLSKFIFGTVLDCMLLI
jgi:hypothetical protein